MRPTRSDSATVAFGVVWQPCPADQRNPALISSRLWFRKATSSGYVRLPTAGAVANFWRNDDNTFRLEQRRSRSVDARGNVDAVTPHHYREQFSAAPGILGVHLPGPAITCKFIGDLQCRLNGTVLFFLESASPAIPSDSTAASANPVGTSSSSFPAGGLRP